LPVQYGNRDCQQDGCDCTACWNNPTLLQSARSGVLPSPVKHRLEAVTRPGAVERPTKVNGCPSPACAMKVGATGLESVR